MSPKNKFGRLAKIRAGHLPIETRDMGWTSPSKEKRYGLDKSQQGQEIWTEQGPAETRHTRMGCPVPDSGKAYALDNSWQANDIWV